MIFNWIAEQLLKLTFHIADPTTARGANIRQSVIDYFWRFRDAPAPSSYTFQVKAFEVKVN